MKLSNEQFDTLIEAIHNNKWESDITQEELVRTDILSLDCTLDINVDKEGFRGESNPSVCDVKLYWIEGSDEEEDGKEVKLTGDQIDQIEKSIIKRYS